MTNFNYNSNRYNKPLLDVGTLAIVFCHKCHTLFEKIRMSSNFLSFVNAHVTFQMPSKIYHNPQTSGLSQIEHIV